jgi:hypothetical protein
MNSARNTRRQRAALLLGAGAAALQLLAASAAFAQQGYIMSSDQAGVNQGEMIQSDVNQYPNGQYQVGPAPMGQYEMAPGPMGSCNGGQCDLGQCGGSCGDTCCDQCSCGAGCDGCCDKCCAPWCHRTALWGEFLYLHPTGVDMVHAQQQNGIGGAGTVPFGDVGAADPNYQPAFRVGGAVACSPCSSVTASYTHFESDAINTVEPPIIPGGGGAVGSLVQHPGAALTASPGPVTAFYDINYQLGDGAYRHLLYGNNQGWMNYSVGGRYAHLEQGFLQVGDFGGGNAGTINTTSNINFDGGGALFGLDGEHFIGSRGLSVYGGLNVSPIFGQFSSRYQMQNITTDTTLAAANWKDDRVVTLLEYQAGLAWTSRGYKWRLSAGYVAQFWYNAVSTADFVSAVQTNNFTHSGDSRVADTISFDGLAARIERRF